MAEQMWEEEVSSGTLVSEGVTSTIVLARGEEGHLYCKRIPIISIDQRFKIVGYKLPSELHNNYLY